MQNEVKEVMKSKNLDIVVLLETKIRFKNQAIIKDNFTEEWEAYTNGDPMEPEEAYSIWILWRKDQWTSYTPYYWINKLYM